MENFIFLSKKQKFIQSIILLDVDFNLVLKDGFDWLN